MPNDHRRQPPVVIRLLLVLGTLPVLAGCSERTGTVSGTVIFGNKPVPGGLITFEPKTPGVNPVSQYIDEQGHYQVTAPVGEYLIMVDNSMPKATKGPPAGPVPPGIKLPAGAKPANPETLRETGAAPSQGASGKHVAIPSKFNATSTSGLSYTVIAGAQSHDVELK